MRHFFNITLVTTSTGYKYFIISFLCFFSFINADAQLLWSNVLKSGESDVVEVDEDGNVYMASYIQGVEDFDPSSEVYSLSSFLLGGSSYATSIVISKYTSTGTLIWVKTLDAVNYEDYQWSFGQNLVRDMTFDNEGNIYLTGSFYERVDFDPGIDEYIMVGQNDDSFLLKLNSSGEFLWVKSWGGTPWIINSDADGGERVRVHDDNLYVCGFYTGTTDFDPGLGSVVRTAFETDAFIVKFDLDGEFQWVRTWGCNGKNTSATCMDIQSDGDIIVAGNFGGTVDFDDSEEQFILSASNSIYFTSSYVVRFTSLGQLENASGFVSAYNCEIYDVVVNESDEIYTVGNFRGSVDFDPGAGTFVLSAANSWSSNVNHGFLCLLNDTCGLVWAKSDDLVYKDFVLNDIELTDTYVLLSGHRSQTPSGSTFRYPSIKKISHSGELLDQYLFNEASSNARFISLKRIDDNTYAAVGNFTGSLDFQIGTGVQPVLSLDNTLNQFVAVFNLEGVVTNLQEFEARSQSNAYPNPTNGEVFIPYDKNGDIINVEILSLDGQILNSRVEFTAINAEWIRLDIDAPAGVYIVNLIQGNVRMSHRVCVLK